MSGLQGRKCRAESASMRGFCRSGTAAKLKSVWENGGGEVVKKALSGADQDHG